MTKTTFTTVTPIPAGVSRQTVLETLHDHLLMIDLNPSHEERHRINPPPEATAEEYHCTWYSITDKVSYLPGGMYSGRVTFKSCFHDLPLGVQIHVYAPAGLDIKEKWTVGGSMPGEPVQPVEIGFGVPVTGLYLREDVEMKCNFLMTKFVRKTLKDSLAQLVARLSVRAQLQEASQQNLRIGYDPHASAQFYQPPLSPPLTGPMHSPSSGHFQMAYPGQGIPQTAYQGPGSPQMGYQGQGSPQIGYQGQGSPHPVQSKPGMPQHPQYAQYNPGAYAAVEVDAVGQQSPGIPKHSPGHPPGPVELA